MKKIITLLLGVIAFLCTACDEQTIYTKDGLICMKRYNGNAQVDREICWYEGTDQKQSEKYWKDEKEDGVWKEWYKNGQLKRETHWKEGKAEGVSKEWHENGKLKTHAEGKKKSKERKKTICVRSRMYRLFDSAYAKYQCEDGKEFERHCTSYANTITGTMEAESGCPAIIKK